jgi:hypothetical protein
MYIPSIIGNYATIFYPKLEYTTIYLLLVNPINILFAFNSKLLKFSNALTVLFFQYPKLK